MSTDKTWPETVEEEILFEDWQFEVSCGDTVLGYRDWLAQALIDIAANEAAGLDSPRLT